MNTLRSRARATFAALLLLTGGLLHVSASSPADATTATGIAVPRNVTVASPAPTLPLGADLGIPTQFAVADSTAACGNGFVSQSEVLKCPTAVANHQLIFVWNFDPNSCPARPCTAPDGFNVVRSLSHGSGPANTFQTALGADRGAILQVTGADVVGSCFYVLASHGGNDFGRRSNTVCIDQVDHIRIDAGRVATAHAYSYDNGTSCKSPDSNPAGYGLIGPGASGNGLIAGYVTRSGGTSFAGALADALDPLAQAITVGEAAKDAGNNTCNHYRDVFQGLMYFDLSGIAAKAAGKTVSKAMLRIDVVSGAWNGGSAGGGDGSEHASSPAPNCAATIGFPTNANVNSDFTFPNRILFDTYAKIGGGVGHVDVDITGMLRAWLRPGGVNRGIVISPSYLDPTHAPAAGNTALYNADCVSRYGTPSLTVDIQ